MSWNWSANPDSTATNGWYAVVLCWDVSEGMFPGAMWWGGSWPRKGVSAFAGPFDSESAAQAWADEHDPEGG